MESIDVASRVNALLAEAEEAARKKVADIPAPSQTFTTTPETPPTATPALPTPIPGIPTPADEARELVRRLYTKEEKTSQQEAEIHMLRQALVVQQSTLSSLQNDSDQRGVHALVQRRECDVKIANLNAELQDEQIRAAELVGARASEVALLKSEVSHQQLEISSLKQTICDVRKEHELQSQERLTAIAHLTEELSRAKQDSANLVTALDTTTGSLNRLESEYKGNLEVLEQSKSRFSLELAEEMNKREILGSRYQSEVTTLKEDIRMSVTEIAELRVTATEASTLKMQLAGVENAREGEVRALEDLVKSLQTQIESNSSLHRTQEETLRNHMEADRASESKALVDKMREMGEQIVTQTSISDSLKQMLVNSEQDAITMSGQLEASNNQILVLSQELETYQSDNQKLRSELSDVNSRQANAAEYATAVERRRIAEEQNILKSRELQTATEQLSEANNKVIRLQSEVTALQEVGDTSQEYIRKLHVDLHSKIASNIGSQSPLTTLSPGPKLSAVDIKLNTIERECSRLKVEASAAREAKLAAEHRCLVAEAEKKRMNEYLENSARGVVGITELQHTLQQLTDVVRTQEVKYESKLTEVEIELESQKMRAELATGERDDVIRKLEYQQASLGLPMERELLAQRIAELEATDNLNIHTISSLETQLSNCRLAAEESKHMQPSIMNCQTQLDILRRDYQELSSKNNHLTADGERKTTELNTVLTANSAIMRCLFDIISSLAEVKSTITSEIASATSESQKKSLAACLELTSVCRYKAQEAAASQAVSSS